MGKLLAEAFDRAGARFRVLDPVAQLSFDVLLEARIEARAELAQRIERERRRIRRAARRIAEAEALDAAIVRAAGRFGVPAGKGRPPPGSPAWCLENLHSDN
jgi:hypothetical protein